MCILFFKGLWCTFLSFWDLIVCMLCLWRIKVFTNVVFVELLRKSAEHTLMDMVQLLFSRLPQFKEDTNGQPT